MRRTIPCCFALIYVLLLTAQLKATDDWPQFRGLNSSGRSLTATNLPVHFSPSENCRWKVDVGEGVGGAVVASGRVFATGMTAEKTVGVFAFDLKSGKKLWQRDWVVGDLPEIHHMNSYASATPASDGVRVYFYFSSLGLIALDAKTGETVWSNKLPEPFFVFKWGPGMSPVLCKDKVIFCQDDDLFPAIYAFDCESGRLLWKDERDDMAVNYSHPVVCEHGGKTELVVAGTGMLIGYDPDTGRRLWYAKCLLRNIKTTPVCVDGIIYVSVQSGGIANQWLVAVDGAGDVPKDGKLSRGEVQAYLGETEVPEVFFQKTFGRGDTNNDGFLEGVELDHAFLHPENFAGATYDAAPENSSAQFIMAVRGGGEGDVSDHQVLWRHETRHTDHIVSPYISEGRMFLIKEGGICTVFDTEKGEPLSRPNRVGKGGAIFASPVSGDGKIFIAFSDGKVVVLSDTKSYDKLAVNDIEESVIATPAISGCNLLIRSREHLFCFRKDAE